jgi:hypothetical protein
MYAEAVAAKSKMGWYGVRTLFRLFATGKPKWTDRYFDPASTLVEDRIILFQAKSFGDAIKQAEAEARHYCKAIRYLNVYGQSVRLKFLGAIDAFSMPDTKLYAGVEVYSSTAIVPNSVRDARVVTRWFGKKEKGAWQARNKFIDGKILRDALTAMKESETKRPARPKSRGRPRPK